MSNDFMNKFYEINVLFSLLIKNIIFVLTIKYVRLLEKDLSTFDVSEVVEKIQNRRLNT